MLESPATDPGRAAEEMQEVRYLRAVIDTLRQELVTERKLVKGFEADLIAARKERYEATRLLRVLNEETVLAGYPCGDRDRTLANVRALRSDLVALAKMYGEACWKMVQALACVQDLSANNVDLGEEAAQLRARLHEAEKGAEAMRQVLRLVLKPFPAVIGPPEDTLEDYTSAVSRFRAAARAALTPAPEANQEAGDGR